jgi:taurine transport system permease protein
LGSAPSASTAGRSVEADPARAGAVPRRQSAVRRHAVATLWFVVPFVLLGLVWAAIVEGTGVPLRRFPQVTEVARAGAEMVADGSLWEHLGASVWRVVQGGGLAILTGQQLRRWLGWAGVAVGVGGAVVGVLLATVGPTNLTLNILFRPFALIATLFAIALAVELRRLARSAEPAAS